MLSEIRFTDDFTEIDKEYKRFKHILATRWCEANELTIKNEEKQLIISIKTILDGLRSKQTEKRNIRDKNIIRALIGTKVLSKYTILNQSICVDFFTQIMNNLPNSIQKRRFFFKCAVKNYKIKSHHLWDNFNNDLHNRILPNNEENSVRIFSIEDALIYIDFLIQYAPDHICLISNQIFSHLFKIISSTEYVLDLNYDILKYTNQTINTFFTQNHKYYANYAIELIRSIFDRVDLIYYQTIEIKKILVWDPIKALATLSILFEKCPDSFFNEKVDEGKTVIDSIYNFLIGTDRSDQNIRCLFIRNLIFCSLIKKDVDNEKILEDLSFEKQEEPNLTCDQFQNIKLLIDKNHSILEDTSFDVQEVVTMISDNIDSDSKLIQNNAYDLLNSCIMCNSLLSNDPIFEFDSTFVDKLFNQDLNFNYIQIIDFLIENNNENNSFLTLLNTALNNQTLETLRFLNDQIRSENDNSQNESEESDRECIFNTYIKNLPNADQNTFCQCIFTYINDNDENIRQLVPQIIIKILPRLLLTGANLEDIFRILRQDKSEKVKISILNCFNDHLNKGNFDNYPNLRTQFDPKKESTLLDILLNDKSPHNVQIETIKFICKLCQFNIFYYNIVNEYLDFFKSFDEKKKLIKSDFIEEQRGKKKKEEFMDVNNYIIFPKKLALRSEFLPYIFESFPNCCDSYFCSFYKFALDYITAGVCPTLKFKRRLNLQLKVTQKTYFQRKFFRSTFISFIKSLQNIHAKKINQFQGKNADLIHFCITNLQEGMGKKETKYMLSFLHQIITKIGIITLYSMYKVERISQLYTVVFDTGSRFNLPEIHQLVFRILGFLGAQSPLIKEPPVYEFDDKRYRLNDNLQEALMANKDEFEEDRINRILFVICFNSVRNLLDDESMRNHHYIALESLINILSLFKEESIGDYLNITLNYFQSMKSNANQDKKEFVHLFILLMSVEKDALIEKVIELSQILNELWDTLVSMDYILETLKRFTSAIGSKLIPCFRIFLPKILTLDDKDLVMKIFVMIQKNCYNNAIFYSYTKLNIPDVLIQFGNEGYYNAFHYLNEILPEDIDWSKYVKEIVNLFIDYIQKLDQNKDLEIYFKDAVDLICGLFNQNTNYQNVAYSMKLFIDKIEKTLSNHPNEFQRIQSIIININEENDDNDNNISFLNKNKIIKNNEKIIETDISINEDQLDKFEQHILSINNFINDEVNTLYIEQWLEKLILFCIKNSSKRIVRFIYPVAKNNQVLANSIFNIAFYSLYISYTESKVPQEIPQTLLSVLSSKTASQHCKAMIIDLIEFMDRMFQPLIKLKDIECPLNSIFSSKPPLALRYAIKNYEEKNRHPESNLQLAYLNVGLLDHYKQFSLSLNNQQITDQINNKYKLPIFEGTVEGIHKISTANSLFERMDWNNFNTQIENFDLKTTTHLFRTAFLINRLWFDSKIDIELQKQKILDEINQGFEALGREGGPHFAQGFSSVTQSIVYGQQFIELQEMAFLNQNRFNIRSQNSSQIISFLTPILMLRKTAKSNFINSLTEELSLLSLCRKSNRFDLMLIYNDLFKENSDKVEFQYEMLHYKIANNLESEQDFNALIEKVNTPEFQDGSNQLGEEYNKKNLIKNIKYQKAVYLAHSSQRNERWQDIISLCKDICINNADAMNLLGLANLNLFKLTNNGEYLNNSIIYYIESLSNEKVRTSNLLQIIYLIFKYYNHDDDESVKTNINEIQKEIEKKIPFEYYYNVISQLISYILSLKQNSFKDFIMYLLTQIIISCPESVIYDYSLSIFLDKTKINGEIVNSPIEEIMNKTNLPHFKEAIELTNCLFKVKNNLFNTTIKFLTQLPRLIKTKLNFDTSEKLTKNAKEIFEFTDLYKDRIYKHVLNYKNGIRVSYDFSFYEIESMKDILNEPRRNKHFDDLSTFLNLDLTEKINEIKVLNKQYINAFKMNDEEKIKDKVESLTKIKEKILNKIEQFNSTFSKILEQIKPNDLFKLSSKIGEMKNMKLPIFGTFKLNSELILINEFDHHLNKVHSLRAPMIIKIRGTDGNLYPFILKESEDLRTDKRVMIFQRFLNRFLKTKIKTYSVVPLTPQMGMIERVNGKIGIINLIRGYSNKMNHNLELDERTCKRYNNYSRIQKLDSFRIILDIKNCENDLRESFWYMTPNSESWFKFVKNFSDSCAVTSIVGYVIGIGDRHLENIMIDTREGYLMHIDFCDVFEAAQARPYVPEKVPFRLTRNLVSALGLCGTKGTFSLKCEETLSIVRENRESILNILSVFVHSPIFIRRIVDFGIARKDSEINVKRTSAETAMKRIVKKVNGTDNAILLSLDDDDENNNQPLSVHDHVQKLIDCATDPYNLCAAFSGWRAWI